MHDDWVDAWMLGAYTAASDWTIDVQAHGPAPDGSAFLLDEEIADLEAWFQL